MPARHRRITLAVLAVLATLALLAIGLMAWVRLRGDMLDGTLLIEPSTAAYVEVHLNDEDAGARALARAILDSQGKLQARALQAIMFKLTSRNLSSLGADSINDSDLDQFLPLGLFLTGGHGDADAAAAAPILLAISMPSLANTIRLFGFFGPGLPLETVRADGGETLYRLGGSPPWLMAQAQSHLLLSRDQPALLAGMQRAARRAATPAPLATLLPQLPAGAAVRLAATNGPSLALLLGETASGRSQGLSPWLASPHPVALWLRLETADTLAGELTILGPAAAIPAEATATVDIGGDALDVSLSLDSGTEQSSVWNVRIEGLLAPLQHAARFF